jgi:hypothetical protein
LEAEADGIIAAVDEADIIMKEEDKKICSYDVVQPPAIRHPWSWRFRLKCSPVLPKESGTCCVSTGEKSLNSQESTVSAKCLPPKRNFVHNIMYIAYQKFIFSLSLSLSLSP